MRARCSSLNPSSRVSRSLVLSAEEASWPPSARASPATSSLGSAAPAGAPVPAPASPGRNRSATFWTFRTLDFSATITFTLAVIPGKSLPPGLATSTTTV